MNHFKHLISLQETKTIIGLMILYCISNSLVARPNREEFLQLRREQLYASGYTAISSDELRCNEVAVPSQYARPLPRHSGKKRGAIKISQKTFNTCGSNGVIIDTPGTYKLSENIHFTPTQEGTTAITIAASNVTLDLGEHILSQGNDVKCVYGIAVARDVSCITITGKKNRAKILDFTLCNIRVLGRTDSITLENITSTQTEVRQVRNEDIPAECSEFLCTNINIGIQIGEGDTSNVSMVGTNRENKVTNVVLKDITAERSAMGCHIVFTSGITVTNSTFTENTYFGLLLGYNWLISDGVDSEGVGIQTFPVITNGLISNCRFDHNNSDNFIVTPLVKTLF